MDLKELTFGVGSILRERVGTYSVNTSSGEPNVYPDHPPLELSKSAYPRATVDTIGHAIEDQDVEQDLEIGNVVVDVTAYGVNSGDVVALVSDNYQAIRDYHDKTAGDGSEYLPNWSYVESGGVGPTLSDEPQEHAFTRYSKTQEFEFQHVSVSQ